MSAQKSIGVFVVMMEDVIAYHVCWDVWRDMEGCLKRDKERIASTVPF